MPGACEDLCRALDIAAAKHTCMMRGRRGPEIACGLLDRFMQILGDIAVGELEPELQGIRACFFGLGSLHPQGFTSRGGMYVAFSTE